MTRALAGRAALITGASQGLGRAIARSYVDAGASVLLCARDAALLEETRAEIAAEAAGAGAGQKVLAAAADVSDAKQVDEVVALAAREFPDLQILVNNAGIHGPVGRTEDVDWTAWVRVLEINVLGSVLMCRAMLPHLKRRRYGKIIQLSGGGATSPMPRVTAYAASKAAVVRFAESLALEVRDDGIDVNAIAPGALKTRMMQELMDAGPAAAGEAYHKRMAQIAAEGGTPLDKPAALAVFLGSAASDGITGRLISAVWDQWSTLPDHREELARGDVYTLRRITARDRGFDWEDK